MSYRLNSSGQIECDTAQEAVALLSIRNGSSNGSASAAKPIKGRRGGGSRKLRAAITKSWSAAKKLAKAEGITPAEARSRLAKEKKAKAKTK